MRSLYASELTFTTAVELAEVDSGTANDAGLLAVALTDIDDGIGLDEESIVRTTVALADLGVGQDTVSVSAGMVSDDTASSAEKTTGEGSYQLLIASDAPVAYWRLGESAGTIASDFMGSYDATYIGSPVLGVPGAIYDDTDTAVRFGTGANYASAGPLMPNATTISLEVWFYKETLSTGPLMEFRGTNGNAYGLHMWNHPGVGDLFVNMMGADNTTSSFSATGVVTAERWNHAVFTYDGTYGRLYLNGKQVASNYSPGRTLDTSGVLDFARRNTTYANVSEDEAAVYDYVLSDAQIVEHYEAGIHTVVDSDTGTGGDEAPSTVSGLIEADQAFSEEVSTAFTALIQSDTGTGEESAVAASNEVDDADTGTGMDLEVAKAAILSDTDTVVGGDSSGTIVAGGATTDSAIAIESQQLAVLLSQPDEAVGVDTEYKVRLFFDLDSNDSVAESEVRTKLASIIVLSPPHTQQRYDHFVLDNQPVAYWRLGETEGTTAIDETGNGNDGIYSAGVTQGIDGALLGGGDTAAAFPLAAHTESVTATIGEIEHSAAWTVESWVRPQEPSDGNSSSHRTMMATSKFRFQYSPSASISSARFLIQPFKSDGTNLFLSDPTIRTEANNIWWHVVATYDGSSLRLYVNGTLVISALAELQAGTFSTVRMGYDGLSNIGGGDGLRGDLDEPAVYDRALTPAEIVQHYEVGTESRYGFGAVEPQDKPSIVTDDVDAYQFDWATTPA